MTVADFRRALPGLIIALIILTLLTIAIFPEGLGPLLGTIVGALITVCTTVLISSLGRQDEYRKITWLKRFEAHQKAYVLWWEIVGHVHDEDRDELMKKLLEAQQWWAENCLYMTEEASDKFKHMLIHAKDHKTYVDSRQDAKMVSDNWNDIQAVGPLLRQEAHRFQE